MKPVYFFLFISLVISGCGSQYKLAKANPEDGYITTASGLKYTILKKGSGAPAKEGQEVLIFETTTYLDGTVLYSNEKSTTPVKVLIGGHQATDGVDEGLRGMQAGEIRQLIAPPYLVKRKSYPSNVSPDSTLMIKIILHKIL
jgi:FKBP-type peptidyl-prolyl cis-trans isomerase